MMKRYWFIILNVFLASTAMAQRAVDVHSHNILPEFTALLKQHNAALEETFPPPTWNIASHLKFMEVAVSAENMLIRISEIEVYPQYLKEYLGYAYTVGATSVKEESGVICIYPMQMKRDSTQIRILEIYASLEAYQHHIQTAHFRKYKTATLHMVKSLDLVDMHALDPASMPEIFLKIETNK